jgi:chromate reductase, NAD(P)H dehydrogenase (quinone)
MTRLLFIPGSLRAASSAKACMRALIARIGDRAEIRVADPGLLPHYNADVTDDAAVAGFVTVVREAEGVVFVTPEYNYSVPGVLKNAIDWASRPAYESVFKGKPCFIVTTSGGAMGGVRAQGHLKQILNAMLAEVFPCKEILVPMANQKVVDGIFTDEAILAFAEENLSAFVASLQRPA